VSLSAVRCPFDDSRLPSPCFVAIQDLPRSAPCVRIFGSVVWYPMFLRHEIHRHLACQVGGCGVFSSRSALTWPPPTQGSSVFAAAMPFGGKPSPSSIVGMSRLGRKRRKIRSPPTSRPGIQSLRSPSPPPPLLALVLGVSCPLRRLSPWRRSCCTISPLMTGVRGGALESLSSSPSPTKTRPREEPRARENQIRRRGAAPQAPEMGRPPRPRRWLPTPHLRRTGSPAAKSSNAL
jgi:hypothetical protein